MAFLFYVVLLTHTADGHFSFDVEIHVGNEDGISLGRSLGVPDGKLVGVSLGAVEMVGGGVILWTTVVM